MSNILIIDDDPDYREVLCGFVEAKGDTPYEAGSADEGMQTFLTEKIDLVISDLVMPDKDGLEFLKEMKMIRADTLFIMVTGFPEVETAVKAMKEGAYDYLMKPVDKNQLTSVLNRALGALELRRSLSAMKGINTALLMSIPVWLVLGGLLFWIFK